MQSRDEKIRKQKNSIRYGMSASRRNEVAVVESAPFVGLVIVIHIDS